MARVKQTNKPEKQRRRPVVGIALGGGGPMGGVYQIGALRAIDEALDGLDLNDLAHYVGVNAGAFVAANLANQITPAQMCRIFVRNESDIHPFHPQVFYKPAFSEYIERIKAVPSLFSSAVRALLSNPSDQSVLEYLTVMSQAVPSGVFDNEGFNDYVARSFTSLGRTNDFSLLRRNLMVIAADLETGETVRFGTGELKGIPISKAIQASMAAPGIYVPVGHEGRFYMDGTLNKGLHCSVAFEQGCDVVLAINPIVPVDVFSDPEESASLRTQVLGSGMGRILAQSYRTMVQSRLDSGLKNVHRDYPNSSLFLFEPSRAQAKMFLSSVFSFKARRMVCEQAYQATRAALREQVDELNDRLGAGVRVRQDILDDPNRTLSTGLYGENIPSFDNVSRIAEGRKHKSAGGGYLDKVSEKVSSLF